MPFQKRIEIMAPAGSFESLAAALQGGADSCLLYTSDVYKRQGYDISSRVNVGDGGFLNVSVLGAGDTVSWAGLSAEDVYKRQVQGGRV